MMGIHALVIHPNNEVKEIALPSPPDCRGLLDGALVEAVPLAGGTMYVDKERLSTGHDASDASIIATRLLQMVGITQPDTWVLGSVVVVGLPDRDGYDTNIPPKLHSFVRLIEAGVKAEQKRHNGSKGEVCLTSCVPSSSALWRLTGSKRPSAS